MCVCRHITVFSTSHPRPWLQIVFVSDLHGAQGLLDRYKCKEARRCLRGTHTRLCSFCCCLSSELPSDPLCPTQIDEADVLCCCGDLVEHETGPSWLDRRARHKARQTPRIPPVAAAVSRVPRLFLVPDIRPQTSAARRTRSPSATSASGSAASRSGTSSWLRGTTTMSSWCVVVSRWIFLSCRHW